MELNSKCLIIDDDQDDQEIFFYCVQEINDNVDCLAIEDSIEALNYLNTNVGYTPDYIFLDVNLPRMTGIECLRKLMKIERLKCSRIFMYSTTAESSAVEESKALGADDFIIKPAKIEDLKKTLTAIFNVNNGTEIPGHEHNR